MTDPARVTFGIKTSQATITYERILAVWRDADAIPAFEHAWLWDHMVPLRGEVTGSALEAWTLLAALAAQTARLRLGVIVTSNRLRPPAVLAKMAATVDIVSGGRLIFGIGAGGSLVPDPAAQAMVRREFEAYGIDLVTPGEATGALGEAITIIRRLWAEAEPFDFDGHHYRLAGAIGEPKPVQRPGPPILIAANGERGLRIAAEHADLWIGAGDLESFRTLSHRLDERCAEVGRDPGSVGRLVQVIIRASDAAATVDARDLLRRYIDAGASHVVLAPNLPDIDRPARWLADEIIGPIVEDSRGGA